MNRVDVFAVLFLVSLAFATCCGGRPERRAALMLFLAGVLSILARGPADARYLSVEWPRLIIDAALLGGLLWLTAISPRRWPKWMAGTHAITVAGHLARPLVLDAGRHAYQTIVTLPSWIVMILLIAATANHLISRHARLGDGSWLSFLVPWAARRLGPRPPG